MVPLAAVIVFLVSLDPPEFRSITGLELLGGEDGSLSLQVGLILESYSGFETELQEIRYEVSLNGARAAEGSWTGDLTIPGEGEFAIDLPVSIAASEIPIWLDVLCEEDSVELGMDCEVVAQALVFTRRMEFEFTEKTSFDGLLELLMLREALRLSPWITDISMPGIGLLGSHVDLTLGFSNPYPFPIAIQSIDLDFISGGATLGNLTSMDSLALSPEARMEMVVRLSGSHVASLVAAVRTIRERALDYRLVGTVAVRVASVEIPLPIDKEGELSLSL